jgi:hypothetical protein
MRLVGWKKAMSTPNTENPGPANKITPHSSMVSELAVSQEEK